MDVDKLGQVFTPDDVVDFMLGLRKNHSTILEPSVGDGAFFNRIKHEIDAVGIEIDPKVAPEKTIVQDFIDYDPSKKFATCVGNPPYVGYKMIGKSFHNKLMRKYPEFDNRTNLYVYFIHKCFQHLEDHGELIFITPREFLKATCARKMNEAMHQQGTFTHLVDLGDRMVFKGFSPNCVIFRYEKGNMSHRTLFANDIDQMFVEKTQSVIDGQLMFSQGDYTVPLNMMFDVKVGAVSGCDEIFAATSPLGNRSFVYSQTCTTNQTRLMHYFDDQSPSGYLAEHKDRLIKRGIKSFDESNWWHWGRKHHVTETPRIYVNCKTRIKRPFFVHDCNDYDGSVLALFLKNRSIQREMLCDMLNDVDWDDLGFMCGNRYVFSQKALANAYLPTNFANAC